MNVPLSLPLITDEEIECVANVLRSGWLAHGEWNEKFEASFAEKIGVQHAIAMNSCTSALEIALLTHDIKGEVVIPSMTWVATANAVIRTGGTPIFCEIDPSTRNVTAQTILEKISNRTEAVIIVHFGGQPCQMDDIEKLCRDKGLLLIEDSAETLGATWKNKQAGSFGIGCFSFFPTKNITTGEGGMFTCNDTNIAKHARALISHGVDNSTFEREKISRPWIRSASFAGHNFRMPNPLAALGFNQLQRLDEMNVARIKIATAYNRAFTSAGERIKTPITSPNATHVYQMYTIEVGENIRDTFVNSLRKKGIGASVHFDPPVHLQNYYINKPFNTNKLPITENLSKRLVSLPIYPSMSDEQVNQVISVVLETLEEIHK